MQLCNFLSAKWAQTQAVLGQNEVTGYSRRCNSVTLMRVRSARSARSASVKAERSVGTGRATAKLQGYNRATWCNSAEARSRLGWWAQSYRVTGLHGMRNYRHTRPVRLIHDDAKRSEVRGRGATVMNRTQQTHRPPPELAAVFDVIGLSGALEENHRCVIKLQ